MAARCCYQKRNKDNEFERCEEYCGTRLACDKHLCKKCYHYARRYFSFLCENCATNSDKAINIHNPDRFAGYISTPEV